MSSLIKDYAGPAALAILVLGGTFTAGATYGTRATIAAMQARLAAAQAAKTRAAAEPAKLAPAQPNPDPRTIASPASQYPAGAPTPGTVTRVVGDRVMSTEPISASSPTATVPR